MHFTFSDTIAGSVVAYRADEDIFTLKTIDGREFDVQLTSPDVRGSRPQPRRGLHRRDAARCATCSTVAACSTPTASSIPRTATTTFEAKHIVFVGRTSHDFAFERPDWWVAPDPRGRRLLHPGPVPGREHRLRRLPHADQPRGREAAGHAPGDRHDLAPGLRLRDRLPADRRGSLPRSGREAAPSTCASTCASSTRTRTSSTGTTASTSPGRQEKKILASEFGDDYDAIPAYEQIYALAGPTQTYRITGDPRIRERHRHDARAVQQVLPRPGAAAASSRTSTRSRSTRAASRSAHNQGAQELELGRRPRPGVPDQPVPGDRRASSTPTSWTTPSTRSRALPRLREQPVRATRSSTRTGRHDHAWGWQQNRGGGRPQPEDRLEPDADQQRPPERQVRRARAEDRRDHARRSAATGSAAAGTT